MNEKPESEEFDEEDEVAADGEEIDLDHLISDLDRRKKAGPKPDEPAWRRLERYREERYTAELLSDFEDYEIGDGQELSKKRRK